MVLEKTLESPLDCKEIQPVHPKGDQSWVFIGRTDVEAETPILWCSAFFTVQLSHPYMTTGKTISLTRQTFVGKVMFLLFNMLSRLVITFLPRSKRLLISWLQSPTPATAAKSLQLCPTLCDPIPGILQARTLEGVAISFSSASKWNVKVKSVAQSCRTLHDPVDCSLPGSSVRGIFQARVLEWGAIAFSHQPLVVCN